MTPAAPSPAALSTQQVRKVAALARLAPSDADVERYRVELSAILAYVQRLQELPLTGVEPLANPVDEPNRLRSDIPAQGLPEATLLAMAPETAPPFVAVPRVLGDGGGP